MADHFGPLSGNAVLRQQLPQTKFLVLIVCLTERPCERFQGIGEDALRGHWPGWRGIFRAGPPLYVAGKLPLPPQVAGEEREHAH